MKESTKSLIDIEVEYGVVSFKNKNINHLQIFSSLVM